MSEAGQPASLAWFVVVLLLVNFVLVQLFVAVVAAQFGSVREKYETGAASSKKPYPLVPLSLSLSRSVCSCPCPSG
jgi:hypothetical protein